MATDLITFTAKNKGRFGPLGITLAHKHIEIAQEDIGSSYEACLLTPTTLSSTPGMGVKIGALYNRYCTSVLEPRPLGIRTGFAQ